MKKRLYKLAPFIIAWAMGVVTWKISANVEKGFDALIAIVEVMK